MTWVLYGGIIAPWPTPTKDNRMSILSKLTLRYQRRAGFPGYSHVELETIKEIMLEDGDDPDEVERAAYFDMAEKIQERIQPLAAGYKPKDTTPPGRQPPPRPTPTPPPAPEGTAEKLREAAKDAALSRAPVYNDQFARVRTTAQKSFAVGELDEAWQALVDAGLVDTAPSREKAANEARGDIRTWLLMSPLDPLFAPEELEMVVESYSKWRGQGLTSTEAMTEVGNDYIGHYYGSDDSGSGEPSEGAESDKAEGEPVDQGPGDGDSAEEGDTEPVEPTADSDDEADPGAAAST